MLQLQGSGEIICGRDVLREKEVYKINIVVFITCKKVNKMGRGDSLGNVRPLNHSKYAISKNRFLELYYWCLQYGEWKDELKYKTDTVGAMEITDMPRSRDLGNATQQLAMRRVMLEQNCRFIEQTAIEADPDIYKYILKAVTEVGVTYHYLKMFMDIPCGRKMYYDRRRRFYWLLSQKK